MNRADEAGLDAGASPILRAPAGRWGVVGLLSTMMFLQYAIWGSWAPVLSMHLKDIGFSGAQTGQVFGAMALASMVAPWLAGQLADRLMQAQHVVALVHLAGAAVLWVTAGVTRFGPFYQLSLLYALLYVPSLSITNLIALRHIADRQRDFGLVRLWGTIGWIAASWALGVWLSKPEWLPGAREASLADCLRQAAILSVGLGLFAVALPATPPIRGPVSSPFAPFRAVALLKRPSFGLLIGVGLALAIAMPFYYQLSAPFLRAIGTPAERVGPLLTIGQVCEIAVLAALPLFTRGLGVKATFLIGIAAWGIRFGVFALGGPYELVAASLGLHGFCFAFVFALGQVYVDQHSEGDIRASAQGLFTFVTLGVGMWIGNALAGASADHLVVKLPDGREDYCRVFLWPALGAGICLVIFALFFREGDEGAGRGERSRAG